MSKTDQVRVYSYSRFSTPEQQSGGSLQRQDESARRWCEGRGHILDESLCVRDEGVSAFRGKNATEGALAGFLTKVRDGVVPKGSILLVENFDRFSRADVLKAVGLLLDIIKGGVKLAVIDTGIIYDGKTNERDLMYALMDMSRAHGESKRKSEMRKKRWEADRQRMRESKVALTSACPCWLRRNGTAFVVIEPAAVAIQEVFRLRLEGFGPGRIAKLMNDGSWWTPTARRKDGKSKTGDGWKPSFLKKLLRNPQVTGLHQPHVTPFDEELGCKVRLPDGDPIENYYPVIVDKETFDAVSATYQRQAVPTGKTGKWNNVFRGLAVCGFCGSTMHFDDKGHARGDGRYLRCSESKRGGRCDAPAIPYLVLTTNFLRALPRIDASEVLRSSDERHEAVRRLRRERQAVQGAVADLTKQAENLANAVAEGDDDFPELLAKMKAVRSDRQDAQQRLVSLEAEIEAASKTAKQQAEWSRDIDELVSGIEQDTNDACDLRLRLNARLRDQIDRLELFAAGSEKHSSRSRASMSAKHARPSFDLESYLRDTIEEHLFDALVDQTGDELDAKHLATDFVQWVAEQRATKRGAFARVWLKGRASDKHFSDFALGPLASGRYAKLSDEGEWVVQYQQPAIGPLLEKYVPHWLKFEHPPG